MQPAISITVSIEAKAVREPAQVELKTLTAIPKATGQVKEVTPGLQLERVPRKHPLHAADKSKAQPPPTSTRALVRNLVSQPLQAMSGLEQKQEQLFFVPLMEICQLNSTLLERIPNSQRSEFATVKGRLLHDDVDSGHLSQWSQFFMFPKCIFWSPVRGGKRLSKRTTVAQMVSTRIEKWKIDRKALWKDVQTRSQKNSMPEKTVEQDKAKLETAEIGAFRIGDVRKALQMLNSAPIAAKTPETLGR